MVISSYVRKAYIFFLSVTLTFLYRGDGSSKGTCIGVSTFLIAFCCAWGRRLTLERVSRSTIVRYDSHG